MDTKLNKVLSEDVLAAYLDGRASADECRQVVEAMSYDAELREVLLVSSLVDKDLSISLEDDVEILPMSAMVATHGNRCDCSPECERYILERRGIDCNLDSMMQEGRDNQWYTDEGTAIHNIGRHLERRGLAVVRRFHSTLDDIIKALAERHDVIAVVDGGEIFSVDELNGADGSVEHMCRCVREYAEDMIIDKIPDHCVVVKSYDADVQTITLYDPNRDSQEVVCPISHFLDAWHDSKCYLVEACPMAEYIYNPTPIDLSDVNLDASLDELREAIAENAHEVWAFKRKREGWSYGPERSDVLKQTPDMVPYAMLTESEKQYDREMAMQTIKLVRKLGYDIVKRRQRGHYHNCHHCGAYISDDHIFCHRCGQQQKP